MAFIIWLVSVLIGIAITWAIVRSATLSAIKDPAFTQHVKTAVRHALQEDRA